MTVRRPNHLSLTRRTFAGATATGLLAAMHGGSSLAQATPVASPSPGGRDVETPSGRIRGLQFEDHSLFLGIPYAQPPAGDLRWRAPEPPEPWSEPLDATSPGPIAPQAASPYAALDSLDEDCLYLNVTVPNSAGAETPQPVMVWIHGGGGTNGSGDIFDARRLAVDEDVVVVTLNYRLGIFGAFGYPGLDDGGTFGLLDQQAALEWVRSHIEAFGGDPNMVMLFGESYGALSVSAHLVSPLAEGLFHRAGIQSGLALIDYPANTLMPETEAIPSMWLTTEELEATGEYVAEQLGVTDPATALDELRAMPVDALLPMSGIFSRYTWGNRVLPEDPVVRIRAGDVHQVPIISGSTRDEANLFVGLFWDLAGQPVTAESYPELIASAFGDDTPAVEAEYPVSEFSSPSMAWATIVTDRVWAQATLEQHRGLATGTDVWAYEFADREAPPILEMPEGFDLGACHSAEVTYQFDLGGEPVPLTESQWELARRMNGYWANMARFANPNREGLPEWSAFDGGNAVLALDDGPDGIATIDFADGHNLAFWNLLTGEN